MTYVLRETTSSAYEQRTEWNVRDSDGTVVFTYGTPTGGSELTMMFANKHQKPCLHVDLDKQDDSEAARALRNWIKTKKIRILNVAGSRASKAPRIADRVGGVLKGILQADRTSA
jgi:hypothetical protein